MTDRRKRRWLFAASLLLLLALTALALRRQPKIYSNEARVLDAEAISGLLDTRQEVGTEDDEKSGELYRKEEKLPYCAYARTFYVPVLSGKMPRAAEKKGVGLGRLRKGSIDQAFALRKGPLSRKLERQERLHFRTGKEKAV